MQLTDESEGLNNVLHFNTVVAGCDVIPDTFEDEYAVACSREIVALSC